MTCLQVISTLTMLLLTVTGLPFQDQLLTPTNSSSTIPTPPNLLKRACTWNPSKSPQPGWDCDNHYLPLSATIAKIRDIASGGGAFPTRPVYFYTNLRDPHVTDFMGTEEFWEVHIRWIESWFASQNKPRYGYPSGVSDKSWLAAQVIAAMEQPMDQSQLDMSKTWPYPEMLKPADIVAQCYMQALAAAAVNEDAYLFTAEGARWGEYSMWALVEYWKLTQNKNVKRIWRVDPTPGRCERDKGVVMWERGGHEEVQPGWVCPIKEPAATETEGMLSFGSRGM